MLNGLLDCVFIVYFPTCSYFTTRLFYFSDTQPDLAKTLDSEKAIDGVAEKSNPPEDRTYSVS